MCFDTDQNRFIRLDLSIPWDLWEHRTPLTFTELQSSSAVRNTNLSMKCVLVCENHDDASAFMIFYAQVRFRATKRK